MEAPLFYGEGKREADAADIDAALSLFWSMMSVMTGLVIVASLIGLIHRLV